MWTSGLKGELIKLAIRPGEALDLTGKFSGTRMRMLARSATQTWDQYADQDLWLVPETGPSGQHR